MYEVFDCCQPIKLQDFGVMDVGHYQVMEPRVFLDNIHAEPELQRGGLGPLQAQRR